ncbi:MAG TPA: polysaccharide ABC transporter ATP-binding protein [Vicinamibacterales bacterium]|nr:polysaccharide ABC transporter ATP-binding protein [Vicinamibacterales bacterium]
MSSSAIAIRDLGKRYTIGVGRSSGLMRDSLAAWLRAPLRRRRRDSSHGSGREFWALRNVTLDVARGDIIGIVGPNGAGKSTLLKILSRITPPTEGVIDIHGRVSSLLEVGTGFHPELTGRENVFLNGAILGMTRQEIRTKFDAIVAFAELERFIDTPVRHYSSGMFVRLAFSVAAHLDPEILIVDEVLSVGDLQFRHRCLGHMQGLRDEGRTVLFVSHDLTAIRQLCTRAAMLHGGRVVDEGTPDDVTRRYEVESRDPTAATGGSATRLQPLPDFHLERVELRNAAGVAAAAFDAGDVMEIHLWSSARAPANSYTVEFHLYNEDDRVISYGAANPVRSTYYNAEDRHYVCRLGPLPLTEGAYFFSFAIGVWNDHRWDRWDRAVSFRIERCDPFKTGHGITNAHDGDLVIPQDWRTAGS